MNDTASSLDRLRGVLAALIGPDGCPWDKEQTPLSLCDYLAEETFELIDAVRRNHLPDIREELGDVLFLILFIATLYKQEFSLEDALDEASAKMIRRHPHVFADKACADREALLNTWEAVKKTEKTEKADQRTGVFASLPDALPPLLKAYRVHAKAARAGFTWDSDVDVEQQVEAEWLEWLDAAATGDPAAAEHEFGDLLFSLVELGRRKGIKANAALHLAVLRFLDRFRHMEERAAKAGQDFSLLDMDEKNRLWDEAKAREKENGA